MSPKQILHVRALLPVSANAADTAKNAGVGIGEYASLCLNQISCNLLAAKWFLATLQLAQLAFTDVTYLKSVFLRCSKTVLRKLCHAATGNYCF